jgi:hypothetical protein
MINTAKVRMFFGYAVAQLVEALRYKSEGHGFDSWWCHWNFSLTYSFRPQFGPGVDQPLTENEYQEYFLGGKCGRCVGLTNLAPSCTDCLEIWGGSASWNPQGLSRPVMGLLYFFTNIFISNRERRKTFLQDIIGFLENHGFWNVLCFLQFSHVVRRTRGWTWM